MEELLAQLKNDIFAKMDDNKEKLEKKIDSIKEDMNTIISDVNVNKKKIEALDEEVKNVTVDMETIKYKVELLEAAKKDKPENYAEMARKPPSPKASTPNSKARNILNEAKKSDRYLSFSKCF